MWLCGWALSRCVPTTVSYRPARNRPDNSPADSCAVLRRHLSGPEGLDDVPLHPVLVLAPTPFGRVHFAQGAVRPQLNASVNRTLSRGLFSVERIAHTAVKAGADRKYFLCMPFTDSRIQSGASLHNRCNSLHLCGGACFDRVNPRRVIRLMLFAIPDISRTSRGCFPLAAALFPHP